MEINVHDDKKQVEVWLTNQEKNDPQIQQQLKPIYAKYHQKNYLVAVFESGPQSLYQNTLDLLTYNKKRIAQLDVQRRKKQRDMELEM